MKQKYIMDMSLREYIAYLKDKAEQLEEENFFDWKTGEEIEPKEEPYMLICAIPHSEHKNTAILCEYTCESKKRLDKAKKGVLENGGMK